VEITLDEIRSYHLVESDCESLITIANEISSHNYSRVEKQTKASLTRALRKINYAKKAIPDLSTTRKRKATRSSAKKSRTSFF
jgi:hypothetical protein